MRFAWSAPGYQSNAGMRVHDRRRSWASPAHGIIRTDLVAWLAWSCPNARTILSANLHTVKLAESPLGAGCGGIETATSGTFGAAAYGFSRMPRTGAREPSRSCAACSANVRRTSFVWRATQRIYRVRGLNNSPVPQIADL